MPVKIAAVDIMIFFFSEKIKLDSSYESSAWLIWNITLFSMKKKKKYLRSATVQIRFFKS